MTRTDLLKSQYLGLCRSQKQVEVCFQDVVKINVLGVDKLHLLMLNVGFQVVL